MKKSLPLLVSLVVGLPAMAQAPIRLSVQPASSPKPALKYQLLPEIRDLKTGNAALLYWRALSPDWLGRVRQHPDFLKASDWTELPLDKLPVERARAVLPRQALEEVAAAARRSHCDWELLDRMRIEGIAMLLPELQAMREMAMLLTLRARLEMREGKLPAAIETLQTGLAMSRHIADGPTLIHALVGMAIANIMLGQVDELIQQDGAPNLYWALTDLPRPFIDIRRPLQAEKLMIDSIFPEIRAAWKDPRRAPLSAEQLNGELSRLTKALGVRDHDRFVLAVAAARVYPQARKYLIEHGIPAARADAMPVVQVGLMYCFAMYDIMYDDIYRWANLPYWQAVPGLQRAEKDLDLAKRRLRREGVHPLAEWLIPSLAKIVEARVRVDRRIAALGCVEALRLYAAAHDAQLPAKLAEIKEVPVPLDPATGKSFQYRLEEYRATLIAPEAPGVRLPIQYEITLRRKS